MLSNRCKAIWKWAIVGALAVTSNSMVHAAEVTVLPTTLGLPPGVAETSTQSVFLHAVRPGSLKIDRVDIEYVSGPDDTRLDAGAADIVEFASGASGVTVPVKVKLTRSAFSRPGTYKIGLRLSGERIPEPPAQQPAQATPPAPQPPTPVDELVELPLTRVAAQISVNLANNSRVTINRGFPWNAGNLVVSISIAQDGGPEIGSVKFKANAVTRSSDNEIVPGYIGILAPEMKVANGSGSGMLVFTDFERAGDFQTNLTFASPSLAKPVSVPITIRVKDNWVLPLLVILAGVFLGAAVHFFVRIWRPRQLSAYRLAQMQVLLESLRRAIGTEATSNEYDRLLVRIQNLTAGIDIDQTADQQIQQLENDITALQTKLAQTDAAANEALKQQQKDLEKAVDDLQPFGGPGDLTQIRSELLRWTQLYADGRAEEALDGLNALKGKFANTRTRLAQAAIQTMRGEIAASGLGAEQKKDLDDKAQRATASLAQPAADIGQILGDVRAAVDLAKGTSRDADAGPQQPPIVRREIIANLAPDDWVAGEPLQFRIEPRPDMVKAIRWTFETSHLSSGASPTITRTYPIAGRFIVAAEIEHEDGMIEPVPALRITILPSEAGTLLDRIRNDIRRVDFGLLILSVIVASVSGLLDRYSDKAFGTVADYCWAFLWGFGIDNVVRGFSATFTRLNAKS